MQVDGTAHNGSSFSGGLPPHNVEPGQQTAAAPGSSGPSIKSGGESKGSLPSRSRSLSQGGSSTVGLSQRSPSFVVQSQSHQVVGEVTDRPAPLGLEKTLTPSEQQFAAEVPRRPPPGLVKVMKGPPPPGMIKVAVTPRINRASGTSSQRSLSPVFFVSTQSPPSVPSPVILPERTPSRPKSSLSNRSDGVAFVGPPGLSSLNGTIASPDVQQKTAEMHGSTISVNTLRSESNTIDQIPDTTVPQGITGGRRSTRRPSSSLRETRASAGESPVSLAANDSDTGITFHVDDETILSVDTMAKQQSDDHHSHKLSRRTSSVRKRSDADSNPCSRRNTEKMELLPQSNDAPNHGLQKKTKSRDRSIRKGSSKRRKVKKVKKNDMDESDGPGGRHLSQPRFALPTVESLDNTAIVHKVEEVRVDDKADGGEKRSQREAPTETVKQIQSVDEKKGAMRSHDDSGDSEKITRALVPEGKTSDNAERITATSSPPGRLIVPSRKQVAEELLSILSPQQFYGKVTKLHRIRVLNSDRSRAPELQRHATILVASKGVLPNQFYYPQLRLTRRDGVEVTSGEAPGHMDTSVVLCEAAPGNMLFANSQLDAQRIFDTDPTSTSCFVFGLSAIMFRDPIKYVLPKAMLDIRWIPYSSPESAPKCPIHNTELQLFDNSSRELCCSLCVTKRSVGSSDYIVVPEALERDSRRQALAVLGEHLKSGKGNTMDWVGQHQRIVSIAKRKKDSITQQFAMLISAVKSKRDEILEQCDVSYGAALSDIAKEILLADEKVALMGAAIDHLQTDPSKPLCSLQVATVASAMHVGGNFPWNTSVDAVDVQHLNSELTVNLEGVMKELQSTSTYNYAPRMHHAAHRHCGSAARRMSHHQQAESRNPSSKSILRHNPIDECPPDRQLDMGGLPSKLTHHPNSHNWRAPSRRRHSPPRRVAPLIPRSILGSGEQAYKEEHQQGIKCSGRWIPLPGCSGTCIYDAPLHELFQEVSEARGLSTRPIAFQWTLRIEDAGTWVGIGVGVGGNLATWSESCSPDLGHLWLVPDDARRQVFVLRVTSIPRVGHAKLTIHNTSGRQLDDGHIPQWRAVRSCYPQVTFGGQLGDVRLIEPPQLLVT
uniref:Uncharacterized protein TCIL3000_11_14920 n=1 Tax=Trypanosoma congolense (strain IL3000) TaxID=1068625 RepID=G0V2V2_TRYCI|nr:unnamed protein product [Trypanosoma congolense IL3000]